jgi:NitT/TauT family transport system permease protein
MSLLRRASAALFYPLAGAAILIALWHMAVATGAVQQYLLPSPLRVANALVEGLAGGLVRLHLLATLQASVLGYLAGCTAAFLIAALVAEFKTVERFLLLHLIAIQAIPKVSIAPLVFLWMGFDVGGKIVLVALVCFFPVFANSLTGLRAADPNLLDLLRACDASRLHVFWTVKLPSAASHVFAGLEIAVAFALIGCVVMEFVGATRGIGFLIQDASNTYDLPTVFAAILSIGMVGVIGNALVRLIHRRVVFWRRGAIVQAEV